MNQEAISTAENELQNSGRTFLYTLRENFGETLNQGDLILRPKMAGLGDITIRIATHDTGKAHSMEAIVDVAQESRLARLAINMTEPTIGGRRAAVPIEPATSVEMGGNAEMIEAGQTLRDVESACDKGEFEAYAPIV